MYQISNQQFDEVVEHLIAFSKLTYICGSDDLRLMNQGRKALVLAKKLQRKKKLPSPEGG